MSSQPPSPTRTDPLFPYPTLFRSYAPALIERGVGRGSAGQLNAVQPVAGKSLGGAACKRRPAEGVQDEAGALDDRDLRLRLEGPFESGNLHLRREVGDDLDDTGDAAGLLHVAHQVEGCGLGRADRKSTRLNSSH